MGTAGLRERVAAVRSRIAQACQRCGRDPSTVTLVAVTKGVGAAMIRQAVACGLTNLGENRVQEARRKQQEIAMVGEVRWHMIGHLQRNKAKDAVAMFDVIHSVDTHALAEEIERQAAKQGRSVEVLVQVNISGEANKFGCAPDEAAGLAEAVCRLPHLRLAGLMTIAPFAEDPESVRPIFRQLRQLRDALQSAIDNRQSTMQLSMGMSQDFEVAVEEGADYLRVGTALFET